MRLTHASFFSGCGGMDLGLERAGWETVSFSEIDPYASAVLARHWPEVPNLGDIVQLRDREVGGIVLRSTGQADDDAPAGDEAQSRADRGVSDSVRVGRVTGVNREDDGGQPSVDVGLVAAQDADARQARGTATDASVEEAGEAGGNAEAVSVEGRADNGGADEASLRPGRVVRDVRLTGGGDRPHHGGGAGRADDAGELAAPVSSMSRAEIASGSSARSTDQEGGDATWKSAVLWTGGFP